MAELKAVVVDDHEVMLLGLIQFLKEAGFDEVITTAEPKEAFQLVRNHQPDLCLIDVEMPEKDGFQVVEAIKQTKTPTKIIIYSMHNAPEVVSRMLHIGVDGFIAKSSGFEEVMKGIRKVMIGGEYVDVATKERLKEVNELKSGVHLLTDREFNILKRLVAGNSYSEVADEFGIGQKTVGTYRSRIMNKLGVSSKRELIDFARTMGLL